MPARYDLLPHEWAFNAFLLLVAMRLALHPGGLWLGGAFVLLMLVGAVLAATRTLRWHWQLRLLWYPCAMGMSFYLLPLAIAVLQVPRADGLLAGYDASMLGAQGAALMLPLTSPWLTDLMTLGYIFFFYYLITGPAHYFFSDLAHLRACFAGMFTTYALGFTGYLLWPAGGPHLAGSFAGPLPHGPLSSVVLPFIDTASNGVDVFPSIHAALSLYLLLFDWRHFRARFWRLLVPTALLWVSTVYLRYHYVVDLAGGLAVSLAGLAVSRRYERSELARRIDAQALA